MANITWEKNTQSAGQAEQHTSLRKRYAYFAMGFLLIGAVGYLVISGMATGSYYMTVDELLADSENVGRDVRVAGAVDGETIQFNPDTQVLTFEVAAIPAHSSDIRDQGGLGAVLAQALEDPTRQRIQIHWDNAEMPDLLQHEAQAILEGTLGEDGIFYADQVLLKCPTRYADDAPQQAASNE